MPEATKTLVDILLEQQFITAEQRDKILALHQSAPSTDLAQLVLQNQFATEVDVYKAKAVVDGLPFIDLNKHKPEPSAINVVPAQVANKYKALPVRKDGQTLYIAMVNPRNIVAVDDIRSASRCTVIRPMASVPTDIESGLKKAYPEVSSGAMDNPGRPGMALDASREQSMKVLNQAMADLGPGRDVDMEGGNDDEKSANDAPIVRMANAILSTAIDSGASDIHIEPDRRNVRIRVRIDGVLQELMAVPKHIQPPLISRYKIMSDMNIAERRVPQDGRIPIKHNNKDYDMRVSCLPSLYGEKIVMRILDKSSVLIGMNKLGFYPKEQANLEDIVAQPNGMFIVTGPTGSGKTTTLYSVLNKLNTIEKNIITVEDPIEYQLSGITQVGVNRKAGLTFATALRCFLRQDPDIIMVGEMRDLETADIGIEAALTGHLVLSTLHTNDAPSATIRLIDMGVEPFLVSATVVGILAQRLARRVCMECREPYQVPARELLRFGFSLEDERLRGLIPKLQEINSLDDMVTLYQGKGCEVCRGKGFKGRFGCFELMRLNAEIAEMVVRRAPLADIKDAAKRNGMMEMREDGLRKILDGFTTPDEVMRVVFTAGF